MDLQTLRIVQAIAELGTITKAAEHLGSSQPAISQHIRKVEQQLSLPLLDRVGRGVRLTDAGQILARHAVSINAAVDAVSIELSELKDMRSGRVRIAAFPSASATIIPALLITMATDYPGVSISYTEAEPPEAVAMLRDGAVDMVLSFSYPGTVEDPHKTSTTGLALANLFEDTVMIALPSSTWGDHEGEITLAELANEQWITGCERCQTYLLNVCTEAGFDASVRMQTENHSALLSMVSGGLGLGLVTKLALNSLTVPEGVVLREFSAIGPRRVHLVTTQRARHMPSLAATISAIFALDGAPWGLTSILKGRKVPPRISLVSGD